MLLSNVLNLGKKLTKNFLENLLMNTDPGKTVHVQPQDRNMLGKYVKENLKQKNSSSNGGIKKWSTV